jgi:hypothetical protein
MEGYTPRQLLAMRWKFLTSERSSWISHWTEISNNVLPRSGRFFISDRNRGERRHNTIYDNTGTRALRTLAAGMMAGMTSPARPWFRLTTSDPDLDESTGVKLWLAEVTRLMQMVFAKSNTYRALHACYEELGAFGTASTIVLPDFGNVIHHYPLTAGEYAIATDHRGIVDTLYREYEMTVSAMVKDFGVDKVSSSVRAMYLRGQLDAWVPITQAIEPRRDRDPSKRDSKNMPWKSCHFESAGDNQSVLRESGYKEFVALCPRWAVSGGDIYGNSPAMEALGDIKQLQHEQLRKGQGIDYKTKPPVQAPTSMKNQDTDLLPGGISFVDSATPHGGIRTAFEVNIDLGHLLEDIRDVRERIKQSFYADLFLMLANSTNPQMTATEVAERHEEKLLMLGPVLERLHNEILSPKIEMTFSRMVEAGIVPPAPEEMHGKELNVEFVSMLAQAQRAIATNSVDRLINHIGTIAAAKGDASVWDKFDTDKDIDMYSDMLGVSPELIVASDKVALVRKQRADAQQAAAQAEQMMQASQTAKNLGSVDTSKQSALTDATRAFSGYT